MTLALWCLPVACLLPYVWSIATIPDRSKLPGGLDNHTPRLQQAQLQDGMGARALGAHKNAFEALPPFLAGVLVAHVVGADPTWSGYLAVAWLVFRFAHGAAYVADIHALRSMSFTAALVCALGQFGLAAMA
jgi:uncharacterized MAPEG superfamily protein